MFDSKSRSESRCSPKNIRTNVKSSTVIQTMFRDEETMNNVDVDGVYNSQNDSIQVMHGTKSDQLSRVK